MGFKLDAVYVQTLALDFKNVLNFTSPISLILIAGSSFSQRRRIMDVARIKEYVFVEADNLYTFLDIAEYHHPSCVIVDLSFLDDSYESVCQFLQLLDIPVILITENLPGNQIQYFLNKGIYRTIQTDYDPLELRQHLEAALHLDRQRKREKQELSLDFSVEKLETHNNVSLQHLISQAIEIAVINMGEMLGCLIESKTPHSEALQPFILLKKLRKILGSNPLAVAQLNFTGDFAGSAQMLFSKAASDALVLSLEEDNLALDELNQLKVELMTEIGNVAINSIIGSLSNALNYRVNYSVPVYQEGETEEILEIIKDNFHSTIILSRSHFQINDLDVEGNFLFFFEARLLLGMLFNV